MEFSINKTTRLRDILLIFLIVFTALLIRRFDAFTNPQPWAEDATIYFLQFEQYGIKSLLIPYGGYLHFVPRFIAIFWGTLHINYPYIPACYNFSAFLVTFFIVLNIWKTSSFLNIRHRILYATSFLFLPIGSEVFMNLTNINWIVSLYLINFLFVRYTDYTGKNMYLNLFLIFIISLSGPFSTLLSPLAILIMLVERKTLNFRKILPLCLVLIGGIIQFICIKFIDPDFYRGVNAPPEQYHLFRLVTNNISALLLLKYWLPASIVTAVSFVAFPVLVCIFITWYVKIDNKRRYILLVYTVIVLIAFVQAYWPNESQVIAASSETARYYFIPFTCIGWLMILSFDKKIKPLYVAPYFVLFLLQCPFIRMVLPDKQWKKQISEYYEGKRQQIEINPGWSFIPPPKK